MFAPILTGMIATNLPFGKVAYAGIQAINSPAIKSAIAVTIATECEIKFCKLLCRKLVALGVITDEEYSRYFY